MAQVLLLHCEMKSGSRNSKHEAETQRRERRQGPAVPGLENPFGKTFQLDFQVCKEGSLIWVSGVIFRTVFSNVLLDNVNFVPQT